MNSIIDKIRKLQALAGNAGTELYATDAMRSENEPSVATQFRRQVKRCLELVDRIETIYG